MPRFVDRLELPFSQLQVFDLVSDIESYPKFVAHIASARILQRAGNEWDVAQTVRLGPLQVPFKTHATVSPPTGIAIRGNDGKLGRFHEDWTFEALTPALTLVTCTTDIEPATGLLRGLISAAFPEVHRRTMQAFAARARRLYG
jgi:coenzyme Q-binding protein COQ10